MTKSKKRKAPSNHAKEFSLGYQKKGNDGNMWEIVENKNNVKRWKKISSGKTKTLKSKSKRKRIKTKTKSKSKQNKTRKKRENKTIKVKDINYRQLYNDIFWGKKASAIKKLYHKIGGVQFIIVFNYLDFAFMSSLFIK